MDSKEVCTRWKGRVYFIVRFSKIISISCTLFVAFAVAQAAPPKVALVLGGGTARGLVHIGVIKALVEEGVPIDLVVGTSMGAVVGGLYAAGLSIDVIDAAFDVIDANELVDLQFPPHGGLFDATTFELLIDELVQGMAIEVTTLPFAAVATPFETNEATLLTAGNLARAIHASLAVPVLFAPVEIEGAFYYDGGLTASVAAGLARELGADVVIAVSVSRIFESDPFDLINNAANVLSALLAKSNIEQKSKADVLIELGLGDTSYFAFDRRREMVDIGYQEMILVLPSIIDLLNKNGVNLRRGGDPNVDHPLNTGWQERFIQGQRRAAMRARSLSVTFDVDLGPGNYRSARSPYTTTPYTVARLGADVSGGQLGNLSLGMSGGAGIRSEVTTLSFRLGYRLDAVTTIVSELSKGIEDPWTLSLAIAYSPFEPVGLRSETTFEVGLQDQHYSVQEVVEGIGFRSAVGLAAGDGVRGTFELLSSMEFDSLLLRFRGFAGGLFSEADVRNQFGFGRPVMMRGVPLTPASHVLIGNMEVGWQAATSSILAEVISIRPRGWGFIDVGYGPPTFNVPIAGLGIGTGVSGTLFGFEPFDIEFDVGYGLSTGVVTFTVRSDVWPEAYRFK